MVCVVCWYSTTVECMEVFQHVFETTAGHVLPKDRIVMNGVLHSVVSNGWELVDAHQKKRVPETGSCLVRCTWYIFQLVYL